MTREMKSAIGMELMGEWWRVRFPNYAVGSGTNTAKVREWCRANATHDWKVFKSHVRFRDHSDAMMFFITFG